MQGLRLKQICEKVGVKRSKIYELVSEGKLPRPIKMGRASVWLDSEVDEALKKLSLATPKQNVSGSCK